MLGKLFRKVLRWGKPGDSGIPREGSSCISSGSYSGLRGCPGKYPPSRSSDVRRTCDNPHGNRRTDHIPPGKAFSTCSSHMIVISLTFGSGIFMYVKPSVKQRISFSKGISVLNTSVVPFLNPFIYTLRNQQVKKAFMNTIHRVVSFSKE